MKFSSRLHLAFYPLAAFTVIAPAFGQGLCSYTSYPVIAQNSSSFAEQLASDRNGNVLLSIKPATALYSHAEVRHYRQGTGWDAASLQVDTDFASFTPRVAMEADGRGMAVWYGCLGGGCNPPGSGELLFANFDPVHGWSAPNRVAPTNNQVFTADLVMTGAGRASLVYEIRDYFNDHWFLHQVDYDPASGWSTPILLNRINQSRNYPLCPQITADSAGDKIVTFVTEPDPQTPYECRLFSMTFNPIAGIWGPPRLITAEHTFYIFKRQVFLDRFFRATILYGERDTQGVVGVKAIQTPNLQNAAWGNPVTINGIGGSAKNFDAAMNRYGNIAVAMVQDLALDSDANDDLSVRYFDPVAGWSNLKLAEHRPSAVDWQIALTLHDNGTSSLLFASDGPLYSTQFHRTLTPGGFTVPTMVSVPSGWSYAPNSVILSSGGDNFSLYENSDSYQNLCRVFPIVCE